MTHPRQRMVPDDHGEYEVVVRRAIAKGCLSVLLIYAVVALVVGAAVWLL